MNNIRSFRFNRRVLVIPIFCALNAFSLFAAATDVSSQVGITHTGFGRNRTTGVWSATLTLTNKSAAAINGPVEVVLTGLPASVKMVNSSKSSGGNPVVAISSGKLEKGDSVKVDIQFTNPDNGFITFTPVTYSGGL